MNGTLTKRPLFLVVIVLVLSTLTGCKELKRIYDMFKTGAPCRSKVTCLDGTCLTEQEGFPGGMCSGEPCAQEGCLSLFAECFPTEIAGRGETTVCLPTCGNGRTCERESEGYECRVVNDNFVCVPGAVKSSVPGVTGSACTVASECQGNDPLCLTTMDNGYCSQECRFGKSDCLNQEPCLHADPSNLASKTLCLKSCNSNEDCRFGYECKSQEGHLVCLPAAKTGPRNPRGSNDGVACNSNLNCKGGTCIRSNGGEEAEPGESVAYPGGYCTTRHCSDNSDCNGANSICVARGRTTACFVGCNTDSDCRHGYRCTETPEGRVCDSGAPLPEVKPDTSGPLQIKCTTGNVRFSIPAGAVGFYIAPFTEDGKRLVPRRLVKQGGINLNIPSQYAFGAVNPDILGAIAPMLFPASNASQFRTAFGGGDYTMQVDSRANRVCYYVIPKMSVGNQISVKIHLVGLRGITAANAASNRDVQALIQRMRQIYAKMSVNVNIAGFEDASLSTAARYRIIRNFNDVFSLVATSRDEGKTLNSNLVVNVFLIQDFAISEAPGLLGVSTGIPGMAGMGGTIGSGLVFTTAALGSNNQQLGQTMAHEIGHFLGLRHTTEHGGSSHDPITDTPQCQNPELQYACPDATNFMFAFSMGSDQTHATPGQAFVVQRSPLVK